MFSKEELENMYCDQEMTQKEIGEKIGVTSSAIGYWMEKYNIETRSNLKTKRISNIKENEIINLYGKNKLSADEIANRFNVGVVSIYKLIKKYNVKRQGEIPNISKECLADLYYNQKMSQREIGEKFNIHRKTVGKLMKKYKIKARKDGELYINKKQLEELYLKQKLSAPRIAVKLGCSAGTVLKKLKKYNITTTRGRKKSNEEFKEEIKKLVGDEYTFLEKYKYCNIEILCRHNECGHEWKIQPGIFISAGVRCPKCTERKKVKTHEDFEEEIKNLVDEKYKLLDEYIKGETKIRIKHNKCGEIFKIKPIYFLNGRRCPKCSLERISKSEAKIYNWLNKNNIDFETQYTFEDCKNIKPLKFDFAIFKEGKVEFLIEYDGKFHYEVISSLRSKEDFILQKKRDGIKNQYCKKNNIGLIRIPYWEKNNIEAILNQSLKNTKQLTFFNVS